MSVPTYKRRQSYLEYEENCLKLVETSLDKCKRFPKRDLYLIANPIMDAVRKLYTYILHIKSLWSRKEKELVDELLSKIIEAIGECDFINTLLNISYLNDSNLFTESQWEYWVGLVNTEIALLEGIKKKVSEKSKLIS